MQVAGSINTVFQSDNADTNNSLGFTNESGFNANGVKYTSILLNGAVDRVHESGLITNGINPGPGGESRSFQLIGIDAGPDRTAPARINQFPFREPFDRELFGFNYFRGLGQVTDPRPDPSNQRRILVINGSTREILFSYSPDLGEVDENDSVPGQFSNIMAAVNSVTPAVVAEVDPFEAWAASQSLPEGDDGVEDDPDGDGIENLFEYFSGSNPNIASPEVKPLIGRVGNQNVFDYQRSTTAAVASQIMISENLVVWKAFDPPEGSVETTVTGELEQVRVVLPDGPSLFVKLEVLLDPVQ